MTTSEVVESRVEALLAQMLEQDPGELVQDDDREWAMTRDGITAWVGVKRDERGHVYVYAPVKQDVTCTPLLLGELNRLNQSTGHCSVSWRAGRVKVGGELVGVTVTVVDLQCLLDEVLSICAGLRETLDEWEHDDEEGDDE